MKLKCKFVINNVAGENIAVALGANTAFKGYIRLNETGKDIFEMLKKDTTREKIIESLKKSYPDATEAELAESVDGIIEKLNGAGLLS